MNRRLDDFQWYIYMYNNFLSDVTSIFTQSSVTHLTAGLGKHPGWLPVPQIPVRVISSLPVIFYCPDKRSLLWRWRFLEELRFNFAGSRGYLTFVNPPNIGHLYQMYQFKDMFTKKGTLTKILKTYTTKEIFTLFYINQLLS